MKLYLLAILFDTISAYAGPLDDVTCHNTALHFTTQAAAARAAPIPDLHRAQTHDLRFICAQLPDAPKLGDRFQLDGDL